MQSPFLKRRKVQILLAVTGSLLTLIVVLILVLWTRKGREKNTNQARRLASESEKEVESESSSGGGGGDGGSGDRGLQKGKHQGKKSHMEQPLETHSDSEKEENESSNVKNEKLTSSQELISNESEVIQDQPSNNEQLKKQKKLADKGKKIANKDLQQIDPPKESIKQPDLPKGIAVPSPIEEDSMPNEPVDEPPDFQEIRKRFKEMEAAELKRPKFTTKNLRDFFDFDLKKFNEENAKKRLRVKPGTKMSRDEAEKLKKDSEQAKKKALEEKDYGAFHAHVANEALADIYLHGKPPKVKQETFDAWETSGFSAGPEFKGLVKECKQHYSGGELAFYCGTLSDHAHKCTGERDVRFIFRGLAKLSEEHSERFEKCLVEESVKDMRTLARDVYASGLYDETFLENMSDTSSKEYYKGEIIGFQAMAFNEEIRLQMASQKVQRILNSMAAKGFTPKFQEAIEHKNHLAVVSAYEECCAKMEAAECANLLQTYQTIYWCQGEMENIENSCNGSSNTEFNDIVDKILDPAVLLINSKFLIGKEDNEEFLKRLKLYNIDSYEDALKNKRKLKLMDLDLYTTLNIIEKAREYLAHAEDADYIAEDFAILHKNTTSSNSDDYASVNKLVQELKKPEENRRCSFNLETHKLHCEGREMLELLAKIDGKTFASKLLKDFLEDAIANFSVPTAISWYESKSKVFLRSYKTDFYLFSNIFFENILHNKVL